MMKRYRVVNFDFDSRATTLTQVPGPAWEPHVRELWARNLDQTRASLASEYGEWNKEAKIQNFADLGPKPFSILAFHNDFAAQVRNAFVVGGYYPALVGACALGERILNHLIRTLRDDFAHTPEYRKVARKDSFDNWPMAIDTLSSWNVLLPDVADKFRQLIGVRNRAIHFNPEIETNDRALALEAIRLIEEIISGQFTVMGLQPWFIPGSRGESYICRDWEKDPFVKAVYLPNCAYVGPAHRVVEIVPIFRIQDLESYVEREVTDAEFLELRETSLQILAGKTPTNPPPQREPGI
jgi:hypothetical protein